MMDILPGVALLIGDVRQSGPGPEGHAVAEGLELGDGPLALTIRVAPGEVVATQVGVVAVIGEQVPSDHQDRVPHRKSRLLLPDAPSEPPVLGRQVGVTTARRRPGALDQHLAKPAVAPGGLAGAAFPAGRGCCPGSGPPTRLIRCEAVGTPTYPPRSRRACTLAHPGDGRRADPEPGRTGRAPGRRGRRARRSTAPAALGAPGPGGPAARGGHETGPAAPGVARAASCAAGHGPARRALRGRVRQPPAPPASPDPRRPARRWRPSPA
jgi:hypothetical protein